MNDAALDLRLLQQQQVAALVASRVAPELRATLQEFVARYFAQVDPEDLQERLPADLYGAALSHWNFARKRAPGRARVRAFNPTLEEHGYAATSLRDLRVAVDMANARPGAASNVVSSTRRRCAIEAATPSGGRSIRIPSASPRTTPQSRLRALQCVGCCCCRNHPTPARTSYPTRAP